MPDDFMKSHEKDSVPATRTLLECFIDSEIAVQYVDKSESITDRNIIPKTFTFTGKNWAIKAFCNLRKDERTFVIDKLRILKSNNVSIIINKKKEKCRSDANEAKNKIFLGMAIVILSLSGCFYAGSSLTPSNISVSGYYRTNGDYVHPYTKRPSGSVERDAPYSALNVFCFIGTLLGVVVSIQLWNAASAKKNEVAHLEYLQNLFK